MKKPLLIGAAAYLSAFWHRLLLQGKIPFHGDALLFYFPNWFVGNRLWSEGHFLLWDNIRNMGQPFLGSPQNQILYPIRWLGLILPLIDYMRIYVVFHVTLAALFGYLLAKKVSSSEEAGWLGGLGFGFAGPLFFRVVFHADFATAAWIPCTFYFLTCCSPWGLAVSLTLQFFSGYPPIFLVSTFGLFCFCFESQPECRRRLGTFWKGAIAALGLTAVQWVPFLEMMKESIRPVLLSSADALVAACTTQDFIWSVLPSLSWSHFPHELNYRANFYIGPFLLGLGVWGGWRGGKKARALLGAAVVFFLLAWAVSAEQFLKIPFFRLIRYPGNWLFLGVGAMVLAACVGVTKLPTRRIKMMMVALVAVDLFLFAWPLRFPQASAADIAPISPSSSPPFFGRVMQNAAIRENFVYWSTNSVERWDILRHGLVPSNSVLWNGREAVSVHALTSRRVWDFSKRAESTEGPMVLDLAGVKTWISLRPEAEVKNPQRADFLVESRFEARPHVFFSDRKDGVKIIRDVPGKCEVETLGAGQVVFSETFYPGWSARIDDRPVSLEPFQGIFQSVMVPEGFHHVTFHYEPWSVKIGAWISLLTGMILIVVRSRP